MIFWYRGSCHFCCFLYLTKLKIIIIMKIKYFRCQIKPSLFSSPTQSLYYNTWAQSKQKTPQSILILLVAWFVAVEKRSHALASRDKSRSRTDPGLNLNLPPCRRKSERCQIVCAPNPLTRLAQFRELTSIFGCQNCALDLNFSWQTAFWVRKTLKLHHLLIDMKHAIFAV